MRRAPNGGGVCQRQGVDDLKTVEVAEVLEAASMMLA